MGLNSPHTEQKSLHKIRFKDSSILFVTSQHYNIHQRTSLFEGIVNVYTIILLSNHYLNRILI